MAFQRDYVLRMIEMMGEFFRRICEKLDQREKMQALDQICRDQCGLSLEAALALKEDSIKELLPAQTLFLLSEIIHMQAEILPEGEEKQARDLRALRILSSLYEEENVCVCRHDRLKELMDRCAENLLPSDYLDCAQFFMAGEQYADGEDAIFYALELAGEERAGYIQQGKVLLGELLCLSEHALVLGGLSKEEVTDAINDLEKWEKA